MTFLPCLAEFSEQPFSWSPCVCKTKRQIIFHFPSGFINFVFVAFIALLLDTSLHVSEKKNRMLFPFLLLCEVYSLVSKLFTYKFILLYLKLYSCLGVLCLVKDLRFGGSRLMMFEGDYI